MLIRASNIATGVGCQSKSEGIDCQTVTSQSRYKGKLCTIVCLRSFKSFEPQLHLDRFDIVMVDGNGSSLL
jgi:hypothetical protein